MGNKSKKKNVSDRIVKTVSKLYARMAEMEVALFQAGVKAEALSTILIEKEIFNETELNNLCNKISEEVIAQHKSAETEDKIEDSVEEIKSAEVSE